MKSLKISKLKAHFRKNRKLWIVIAILVIASIFRFVNYQDRWGLAYDQAHDAVVARYALEHFKLPLLGPFSSAGPFQTGGEWYWLIMAATLFFFPAVITPWIILTTVYVLFVFLIMKVATQIIDNKFGLIVGALAAVSTAQITQGTNLTNQSPIAFIALMCIWMAIRYIKQRNIRFLFFLGLFIGLAASIHLQGIALGSIFIALILLTGIPSMKGAGLFLLGLFIPWIPIFIADSSNNFSNTTNMVRYYLHDQYRIPLEALGRRWLTYLSQFWPTFWSHVIGGIPLFGYIIIGTLAFISVNSLRLKKIPKEIFLIMISFIFMMILIRYTRTPLYDSFLMFTHPFIFLLTGWIIYYFFTWKKVIGLTFLTILVFGSAYKNYNEITSASNVTDIFAKENLNLLKEQYPDKKFSIFDYKYKYVGKSVPLVLYLQAANKLDDNGIKIGLRVATDSAEFNEYPVVVGEEGGYVFVDLNNIDQNTLSENWISVNPSEVYRTTEKWYEDKK